MKRFLLLFLPFFLFATPAQVIILRHAEKLPLKGRERAVALVPFFEKEFLKAGAPIAIYASDRTSAQTILPLAEHLNLPLQTSHLNVASLTQEILSQPDYEGQVVMICGSHQAIPSIAKALGAKKVPKKWDAKAFDRFWVLTFDDEGNVAFENKPQRLLFGDSKN